MATWYQPKRWFDTRDTDPAAVGYSVGKLRNGETVSPSVISIPGQTGRIVRDYASAVWLNVTVDNSQGDGHGHIVVSHPDFEPEHSNVNFGPGQTVANFVPVQIGGRPGGDNLDRVIDFRVVGTDTHLVVDVCGIE